MWSYNSKVHKKGGKQLILFLCGSKDNSADPIRGFTLLHLIHGIFRVKSSGMS